MELETESNNLSILVCIIFAFIIFILLLIFLWLLHGVSKPTELVINASLEPEIYVSENCDRIESLQRMSAIYESSDVFYLAVHISGEGDTERPLNSA